MTVIVPVHKSDPIVVPFAEATEAEIAWVAGLYEGEGTTGTMGVNRAYVNVRIVIRELEVLERVRQIVGCGGIYRRENDKRPCNSITHVWILSKQAEVDGFIDTVWPWLSSRRKQQFYDVLEMGRQ